MASAPEIRPVPRTIRNILFASDFSRYSMQALPYAAELARRFGASVYLCHVITPSALATGLAEAGPLLNEAERESCDHALQELRRSQLLDGINTGTILATGPLINELEHAVEKYSIDLIVAGTHGWTGLNRLVLGSSAEELCRSASRSVLTVGPAVTLNSESVQFKKILVPTDLSEPSVHALDDVVMIAREYEARVTILHVLPQEAARRGESEPLMTPSQAKVAHVFEERLQSFNPEYSLRFGDPVDAILETAAEKQMDLITLRVKPDNLTGIHIVSSVAYKVIAAASCPVLTCR